MNIVKDYITLGSIVVAEDACERETYAAEELRYYFIRMTGHKVDAKRISEPADDAVFVIGSALKYYGEELETLGDDELHWYAKDNKIFFNGGDRGLLYSIYDFLEFLGCRFFTQTCEKIPTYCDLSIEDGKDRRDKPAFSYRELYYRDFWECKNDGATVKSFGSFAAKLRQNGHHTFLPEGAGKPVKYAIFIHSFYHLLPIKEYYKDHPEWFDFNNGVRRDGETAKMNWDLCLTNPEVIDMLIKNTRKALLEHPEAEIISISQNDCDCACHCDKCNAVDEEEGFRSGLLLRVVNTIAEALEEEFPKVKFEMLPYTYARQLPKVTRPRHNVVLRACTIECCFFHPIADHCANEARLPRYFADDLKDWGTTGAPIYIWDYVTSFHHYNLPHPNWRVLQPNMQFFYENNARGMFAQGNETGSHGTDLEELRAYLLCKLMWDPYLDQAALIKEFTDYFYGPAGKYVREYIETLCNNCEECNVCIGCYQQPFSNYLFPKYMEQYHAILDQAEEAVKGEAKYLLRLQKIRLSLRYTELRIKSVQDHEHNAEEMNQFFADCLEHGVLMHEGGPSMKKTVRSFAEEQWKCKRTNILKKL